MIFIMLAAAEMISPRIVVTEHLDQAKDCYVSRVKEGLDKDGKLVISWTINDQGQAVSLKERLNELGDEKLFQCLSEKIENWKFTPSAKSEIQNFLFPFIFKRK